MKKIAILGGGNIGLSLAKGLVNAKKFQQDEIILTRRNTIALEKIKQSGFEVTSDNYEAVKDAKIIVLSVLPQQLDILLNELKNHIRSEQLIISVVSGVTISDIENHFEKKLNIVRAMPNTAIAINQSMTCIASNNSNKEQLELAQSLFDSVGKTAIIKEELMTSATALCACGIAFFLRAIRAASQGGVEIGFHADEALKMAMQTALGAAGLLLNGAHPESEIDKVTSPRGCTIAGLNEMEHEGFSSAMITGIKTASARADGLYKK
ncbi:MAG: pyrroline-5-carboxylate reductase [Bacteroidia bacterium]